MYSWRTARIVPSHVETLYCTCTNFAHPLLIWCLAFLPLCRFAPWLVCPLADSPLGLFTPRLVHPLAWSPPVPGWFAPWLFCPLTLDVSPLLNTGNLISRFIRNTVVVFRPRQFVHDDENKRCFVQFWNKIIIGLYLYFIIQSFSALSRIRMFAMMSDAVYRSRRSSSSY